MANIRCGNTFYIDSTTPDLSTPNLSVHVLVVTATGASAQLVLADPTTGAKKLDVRVSAANTSQTFEFRDFPLVFPNGIKVATCTNCVATAVL